MYCPNCRNNVAEGTKFCQACGYPIEQASQNQPSYTTGGDAAYNANSNHYTENQYRDGNNTPYTTSNPQQPAYGGYGNPADTYTDSYNGYETAVATRKKPKTALIAVIAILVVALITGGAFLIFGGNSVNMRSAQSSPENVVKAFVKAYNNRDAKAMVSLMSESANADSDEKAELIDELEKTFEVLGDGFKMDIEIKSVEKTNDETAIVKYKASIGALGSQETSDTCVKIDGKWYIKTSL